MGIEKLESLALTAEEALFGLIFSLIVLVVYNVMVLLVKKWSGETRVICKVANILAASMVWMELVLGDFYEILGSKDLTYFLIIAAVITVVNTIWDN